LIEIYVTRGLAWREIPTLLRRSGAITGIIGPVIAFSVLFGEVLAVLRVPDRVASYLLSIPTGFVTAVLMILVVLLIVGCFLETIAAIVIMMPILLPMATALKFDPVHFGVFVVCALTIGFITPPIGINLFAASAISGVPYLTIAWRAWPLFVALTASVVVIAFVPWLSLWFR
jgi:C4-dicarboxylate transporter DctM subunit